MYLKPLEINIELSKTDGKIVNIIQGDSGSIWQYCKVSRLDGNDIFPIQEGFQIRKSYAEVLESREQIQAGKLQYKNQKGKGHVTNL